MELKEFFKPTWKKFILPIILIVLFFSVMSIFYSLGSLTNKLSCPNINLAIEFAIASQKNDTAAMNAIFRKMENFRVEHEDEFKQAESFLQLGSKMSFIKIIDPIFPGDCRFTEQEFNVCRDYINRETYECITNYTKTILELEPLEGIGAPLIAGWPLIPYNPLSILDILLNVLFLFFEGYILSCLIISAYNKIKGKRQPVPSEPTPTVPV
jgi:hypothetical protein